MKKIINNLFLVAGLTSAVFFVNSCQDALDQLQPDVIQEENIFVNVKNMNTYFNGSVMNNIEPSYEIYLSAVLSDEVKPGYASGGQEFELHRLFLDPTTPLVSSIWYQHYRVINRVNRLLEGAKNVKPSTAAETTQYNTIIAQARAVRAYSYLQLQAYYSTDMKDDNALGVLLFDYVPVDPLLIKQPRSTNAEVFKFINDDLDFSRNILGYSAGTTPNYVIDKGFVNAVSARLNAYRGKYDLAKQYANEVITKSGLALTSATPITNDASGTTIGNATWNNAFYGGTTAATGNGLLASFNPYRLMWQDRARGETIFSLGRNVGTGGLNIGARWNTNSSTIGGSPMWNWGRNLFNIFSTTPGDIRRYAYLDPTSEIDPDYETSSSPKEDDVLIIDKYPGKSGAAVRNDIKLFRLSEMYLILAEAAADSKNYTEAAANVQKVRVARNYLGVATTPTYSTEKDAFADILKERRVELALEGHRYVDLKRLAVKAGVTMDRNKTDDEVPVVNLTNDSYKYTLPLPLTEVSANPSAKQNPGY